MEEAGGWKQGFPDAQRGSDIYAGVMTSSDAYRSPRRTPMQGRIVSGEPRRAPETAMDACCRGSRDKGT
jgi:hypothetical protein